MLLCDRMASHLVPTLWDRHMIYYNPKQINKAVTEDKWMCLTVAVMLSAALLNYGVDKPKIGNVLN